MNSQNNNSSDSYIKDDEAVHNQLPGFRFHPTDEELVDFYLRRKVDKKPFRIELIKEIDIYKHDPWDLPKMSSTADKEGYFFCKRGKKYKNSARPNRVTGSGFWKATGIDKPVYSSHGGEGHGGECIGLKKTLVYYRGVAGKGTKTDWMMNEFRLPSKDYTSSNQNNVTDDKTNLPEEEVWTICRIFKRIMSSRKHTEEWTDQYSSTKRQSSVIEPPRSTITCTMELDHPEEEEEAYISFENSNSGKIHLPCDNLKTSVVDAVASNPHESMASSTGYTIASGYDFQELLTNANWDELKSVVDFAFDT